MFRVAALSACSLLAVASAWVSASLSADDPQAGSATPAQTNPLLTKSPLPFQAPPFDKIRTADFLPAFEEGMIEANRRHFPEKDFSVYGQGHSTGGPFICMLSQRIPNMAGVCATEHSPFGYLCSGRDQWGGDMGKIIGRQGKVIRSIIEQTKTTIDIQDDGTVVVGSADEAAAKKAIGIIEDLTREVEVGAIYTGQVAFFGEGNSYGQFPQIGWSPTGTPR